MKNLIFISIAALSIIIGCNNAPSPAEIEEQNRLAKINSIDSLEGIAYKDQSLDPAKGKEMMILYTQFSNAYPTDPMSPEYLFKAASVSRGLGKYKNAIELLNNVHDGYPGYDKKIESAYIVAFIYDNDLNDRIMAEKVYKKFIEMYPDHHLSEDAAARLKTLHMTDEELIQHFEQLNDSLSLGN